MSGGQTEAGDLGDGKCLVRWTGRQAVVTLPAHIELSAVGRIREALLSVINRGAAELIVDMTATQSCDYTGHDAVARAYQRAVASGIQLRLAIPAASVRRGFRLSGLDQLIPVYPTLQAAVAASTPVSLADRSRKVKEHTLSVESARHKANPVPATAAGQPGQDLLDKTVNSLFSAGLCLQAAASKPPQAASQRITQALQILDHAIRDIRSQLFDAHVKGTEPCLPA